MKTICMLSDQHPLFDDRIYWKEAVSLKKHRYRVVHIGLDCRDADYISAEGIRIISIRKRVYHSNIFIHKLLKTLNFDDPLQIMMEKIIEVQADAYHIHDLKVNQLGKRILNLPWKPKVVYDIHEDYGDMIRYYHRKKGIARFLLRLYAKYVDWLEKNRTQNYHYYLPTTPTFEARFNQRNPKVPSQVLYNFTNLQDTGLDEPVEKTYDCIYTGLINWCRGPVEIIRATELIKQVLPEFKVLFLGRFDTSGFEMEIRKMVNDKSLEANIHFMNCVPYNQVSEVYKKAKIGLGIFHPIEVFYNTVQIKTFEYMLYGLPIVCSNFGYIHKFVEESNAGIPVNPLDPHQLADAILQLLQNHELYQQLSQNGKAAANTRYHWNESEKVLLQAYKQIL